MYEVRSALQCNFAIHNTYTEYFLNRNQKGDFKMTKNFYDVNHNEGQHEKYPIELPSRNSKKEISPIVDVTEHEVYPLEFANCHRTKPHFDTNGDITEIVTTETEAETEERTTHEQHK